MNKKEVEERNAIYLRFYEETDIIKKFNIFLELFCADDYAHLIDSDENAGEEMRQAILAIKEPKFQTHIYKQNHPRLEAEGREIWGVCIAYQGRTLIGDIASSKEEADERLVKWLKEMERRYPS